MGIAAARKAAGFARGIRRGLGTERGRFGPSERRPSSGINTPSRRMLRQAFALIQVASPPSPPPFGGASFSKPDELESGGDGKNSNFSRRLARARRHQFGTFREGAGKGNRGRDLKGKSVQKSARELAFPLTRLKRAARLK